MSDSIIWSTCSLSNVVSLVSPHMNFQPGCKNSPARRWLAFAWKNSPLTGTKLPALSLRPSPEGKIKGIWCVSSPSYCNLHIASTSQPPLDFSSFWTDKNLIGMCGFLKILLSVLGVGSVLLTLSKLMSSAAESPKYTVTHRVKQTSKAVSKGYARRELKVPNPYCSCGNFQMI